MILAVHVRVSRDMCCDLFQFSKLDSILSFSKPSVTGSKDSSLHSHTTHEQRGREVKISSSKVKLFRSVSTRPLFLFTRFLPLHTSPLTSPELLRNSRIFFPTGRCDVVNDFNLPVLADPLQPLKGVIHLRLELG